LATVEIIRTTSAVPRTPWAGEPGACSSVWRHSEAVVSRSYTHAARYGTALVASERMVLAASSASPSRQRGCPSFVGLSSWWVNMVPLIHAASDGQSTPGMSWALICVML
jgi:hypothetical protein